MTKLTHDEIRQNVRQRYRQVAVQQVSEPSTTESSCCSPNTAGCCSTPTDFKDISASLGYSGEELNAVPDGANLGLGCGNPQAIAQLTPGEVVLDLGSGGGFDCFLASRQVGESGKVIGVDMTPEMVSRARQNALKGGFANVDFRLGEIENLPVADQTVNVIISNCVINLSPTKNRSSGKPIGCCSLAGVSPSRMSLRQRNYLPRSRMILKICMPGVYPALPQSRNWRRC